MTCDALELRRRKGCVFENNRRQYNIIIMINRTGVLVKCFNTRKRKNEQNLNASCLCGNRFSVRGLFTLKYLASVACEVITLTCLHT